MMFPIIYTEINCKPNAFFLLLGSILF